MFCLCLFKKKRNSPLYWEPTGIEVLLFVSYEGVFICHLNVMGTILIHQWPDRTGYLCFRWAAVWAGGVHQRLWRHQGPVRLSPVRLQQQRPPPSSEIGSGGLWASILPRRLSEPLRGRLHRLRVWDEDEEPAEENDGLLVYHDDTTDNDNHTAAVSCRHLQASLRVQEERWRLHCLRLSHDNNTMDNDHDHALRHRHLPAALRL